MSFTFINTIGDLDCLNKELLDKPFLGIDTEFRRTTKDNMKLALMQINDEEEIYLIDPLSIGSPEDHCTFLYSKKVLKIFHSLSEDIEAIYSWTGKMVKNLYDTQLANAFLNGDYTIGYSGLVSNLLDIQIDKSETRSNWIRRPLTDAQLNYAASDVEFLIEIYRRQIESLQNEDKLKWLIEEIEFNQERFLHGRADLENLSSGLTKSVERIFLSRLNSCIEEIASSNSINQTLLFSKRNQKLFFYLTMSKGLDYSLSTLPSWRSNLIETVMKKLLQDI